MKAPLFLTVRIAACLVFLALTHSCKLIDPTPEPTADFTANISSEGVVTFNLTTTDADSFTWDFGDGKSSSDKIPTHQYEKNGTYLVNVTAKGKGGEKVVTHSVRITNITGAVIFWKQITRNRYIEVYVDSKYVGMITGFYSSGKAPDCGSIYCVTLSGLSEGNHHFEAKETGFSPTTWESTFKITGGQCETMELRY